MGLQITVTCFSLPCLSSWMFVEPLCVSHNAFLFPVEQNASSSQYKHHSCCSDLRGCFFCWQTSSDFFPLFVYSTSRYERVLIQSRSVKNGTCSPVLFTCMFYLTLLVRVSSLLQTLRTRFVTSFSLLMSVTDTSLVVHLPNLSIPGAFRVKLCSSVAAKAVHGSHCYHSHDLKTVRKFQVH